MVLQIYSRNVAVVLAPEVLVEPLLRVRGVRQTAMESFLSRVQVMQRLGGLIVRLDMLKGEVRDLICILFV